MNCPVCGEPMEVYYERTTYDKEKQEFDHKRYQCQKDNVWGRLEIPRKQLPQQTEPKAIAQ